MLINGHKLEVDVEQFDDPNVMTESGVKMKNDIKLFNKDCFEFLSEVKNNSIDLILTDPPYAISKKTGFSKVVNGVERFAISMDFGEWDNEEVNLIKLTKELFSKLKNSGTAIIFYDIWKISYLKEAMEQAGFKQLRIIIWEKTNPVPINSKCNYLTNSREIAILGVKKGNKTFHSSYDNGVYKFPIEHSKNRFHPTQKPLKLFEELILKHSNENEIILDCFSGSGTTMIACENTNRIFVGCELNKDYYKKSLEKIQK